MGQPEQPSIEAVQTLLGMAPAEQEQAFEQLAAGLTSKAKQALMLHLEATSAAKGESLISRPATALYFPHHQSRVRKIIEKALDGSPDRVLKSIVLHLKTMSFLRTWTAAENQESLVRQLTILNGLMNDLVRTFNDEISANRFHIDPKTSVSRAFRKHDAGELVFIGWSDGEALNLDMTTFCATLLSNNNFASDTLTWLNRIATMMNKLIGNPINPVTVGVDLRNIKRLVEGGVKER